MNSPGSWFASSAFSVVDWSCAAGNLTLAHEIGHFFGLQHVGDNVSNPDSHYPYDHGALGPVVGFRYSPGISLVPGLTSNGDVAAYDLMSYGSPRWTSVYSYCKAMHEIPGPTPTCFPGWNQ
jgi:hypothetical protein